MMTYNTKSDQHFGHHTSIHHSVILGEGTRVGEFVVMRAGTRIGKRCMIGHGTVFEGDCDVGDDTLIHAQCHITKGVIIGNKVFIAPMFVGANDPRCLRRKFTTGEKFTPVPYVIEDGARIGIGVKVLPGVRICKNALVGAGSVVTRDIPENKIAMGVPAKIVGDVPLIEQI